MPSRKDLFVLKEPQRRLVILKIYIAFTDDLRVIDTSLIIFVQLTPFAKIKERTVQNWEQFMSFQTPQKKF